jgi:hypothetical protein
MARLRLVLLASVCIVKFFFLTVLFFMTFAIFHKKLSVPGSRVTHKSDILTAFPTHIPLADHRTAKEHLLKIIVGGEAGCYLISWSAAALSKNSEGKKGRQFF